MSIDNINAADQSIDVQVPRVDPKMKLTIQFIPINGTTISQLQVAFEEAAKKRSLSVQEFTRQTVMAIVSRLGLIGPENAHEKAAQE